jgi:hypothetical protein
MASMPLEDDSEENGTQITNAPSVPSRALPFTPSAEAPPSRARPTWAGTMAREIGLSLGEMALLAAELAGSRNPDEVTRRFGLDGASYAAELVAWERRFAADPQLRASYAAAYQRLRARLGG